jgi:hypothetical protein
VVADQAWPTLVMLPEEVGIPPLRVRLLGEEKPRPESAPLRVLTLGEPALEGRITDGRGTVLGKLERAGRQASAPDVERANLPRWRVHAVVDELGFPLNATGAVAIERRPAPRAEPISWTPEVNWDQLVSSGRLEDLTGEQADLLTYAKWNDPLLGLAGAYACYANRREDLLPVVLRNLGRLDHELPDMPILQAALDRWSNVHTPQTKGALRQIEADGAVPLFGWGIGIGTLAAENYELAALRGRFTALEPRLVSGSVWTLWRQ